MPVVDVDIHTLRNFDIASPNESIVSDTTYVFSTPALAGITSIDVYGSCISGTCECVHLIGDLPAQLKPCRAAQFLFGQGKLDTISEDEASALLNGLVNGFSIVDDDCPATYECQNYDSILESSAFTEMTALLGKEIEEHKVSITSTKPTCVHSLGAVWKSNGSLRPITDCSRPDSSSINNYMSSTFRSFSYNSVQDAVDILLPGEFMAVVDISSAYRSVSVHSSQVCFQGLSWDFGQGPIYLLDHRLCFGLRCAPNIFDLLSLFIVKIAASWGATRVVNYLDDFLVIGDSEASCLHFRNLVTTAITLLGFQVSWKKVTNPATLTTFLGINIDSVAFELSLPMDKVNKLKDLVTKILNRGSSTKKELECLGGLLSYCSYVVRGGRTFSRRVFDLSASYTRRCRTVPLNEAIKDDLRWWLAFCGIFNGKACIIRDCNPLPLYSDSSFEGFGAWLGKDWFYGTWAESPDISHPGCGHSEQPPSINLAKNINVFELWPLVVGLRKWGFHFTNSKLHFITDNMQVLAMINTGRSSNRTCMSWLREMFWMCFIWNIDICASYIRSEDNSLADALSRLPYPGVADKCSKILSDSNMCCSSHRFVTNGCPQESPTSSPACRTGSNYKEFTPISSQVLY